VYSTVLPAVNYETSIFHLLRRMIDWLVGVYSPRAKPRQLVYPFVGIWMIQDNFTSTC